MVMALFPSLYRVDQLALFEQQKSLLSEQFAALFTVVFFCAEWCAVCRDFSPVCRKAATYYREQYTDTLFMLLDIEDDEAFTGALTIDNFPMMAVFRDSDLIHFSAIRAREDAIHNTLASSRKTSRTLGGHPELSTLRKILFAHAHRQETTAL